MKFRAILLLSVALAIPSAHAAAQGDSHASPSDSTHLEVVKATRAVYPIKASQEGIQGEVIVEVHVNEKGDVTKVDTVSGDPVLAQSALAAAKKWKFKPFLRDGKAIPVNAKLPFDFYFGNKEMTNGKTADGSVTSEPAPKPPMSNPAAPTAATPVQVGQKVTEGMLVHQVAPVYPETARRLEIQGSVVLKAVIDKAGRISSLQPISGPPELIPAAVGAVQQWRYKPYLVNGEPVEVQTEITVNFRLSR